jgi:hypothetical protein
MDLDPDPDPDPDPTPDPTPFFIDFNDENVKKKISHNLPTGTLCSV